MNYSWKIGPAVAALFSLLVCPAHAEVKMPAIFGDHMVLQREAKVPVWGMAAPGEKVTVKLGAEEAVATAKPDGTWRATLSPRKDMSQPVTLTVTGSNALTFQDVLVGDVWLCGGQSNMGITLAQADHGSEAVAQATDPQLRLFVVATNAKLEPQTELSGTWQVCSPESVAKFSAVGYFFGRELRRSVHRPIGLIESLRGGTPAQAWVSMSGLEKDAELKEYVDRHAVMEANLAKDSLAYPGQVAAFQASKAKWDAEVGPTFNPQMDAWSRASRAAQMTYAPPPLQPVPAWPKPRPPHDPGGEEHEPACLFNGMIAPLIPYAIKGVIWYQGEANTTKAAQYRPLFARLITDWREKWGEGDFPFLFVQLAGYVRNGIDDNWPFLRESQAKALALPNTGMATAVDIGNPLDVHPKDKFDVGMRLALVAKHLVYGRAVVDSGPVYAGMNVAGGKVNVHFTSLGGGLVIGVAPWHPPEEVALPTDKLLGFGLAGADHVFFEADAALDGNSVVVSSPKVPAPIAVCYAWRNSPAANLYNKANLPAPPFRSDDWPEPTVWDAGSFGPLPFGPVPTSDLNPVAAPASSIPPSPAK